jgi:serine/threonine-protein kinase RsbW
MDAVAARDDLAVTGADPTRADSTRADSTDDVVLTVPAQCNQVVLVRAVTGHLGAALGLSVAQLADLRLAVDEACGALLAASAAHPGTSFECRFSASEDNLVITVSARLGPDARPNTADIGWLMLSLLVDELEWSAREGIVVVRLVTRLSRDS